MHDYDQEPAELRRAGVQARRRESSRDERNLAFASAVGNRAIQRLLDPSGSSPTASDTLQDEIEEEQGAGDELSPEARARSEEALGEDFSDVRVHHDAQADNLSRAVGAKAFTTGSDIFFKSGAYDPDSSSGQKLLAHELTHVFQQRTAGAVEAKISEPTDASEIEAEHTADAITHDGPAPTSAPSAAVPAGISKDEDEELEDEVDELKYDMAEAETEEQEEENEEG